MAKYEINAKKTTVHKKDGTTVEISGPVEISADGTITAGAPKDLKL